MYYIIPDLIGRTESIFNCQTLHIQSTSRLKEKKIQKTVSHRGSSEHFFNFTIFTLGLASTTPHHFPGLRIFSLKHFLPSKCLRSLREYVDNHYTQL